MKPAPAELTGSHSPTDCGIVETRCWLGGGDARGTVSGCTHVRGRQFPVQHPAQGTAAHACAGPGSSCAPPTLSASFPRGVLITQTKGAAENSQTGRRAGSDSTPPLMPCVASSPAACDRGHAIAQSSGAQLFPEERDCLNRLLPENSQQASAWHWLVLDA